jgi:hypothetical protein
MTTHAQDEVAEPHCRTDIHWMICFFRLILPHARPTGKPRPSSLGMLTGKLMRYIEDI